MKIHQKFKFTATAAILAFGVGNKGYTQNTSQSVMNVQVTVLPVLIFQITPSRISAINCKILTVKCHLEILNYNFLMGWIL